MLVRVAFPLALPEPLTYAVPPALEPFALPGVRVRARLRGVSRVGLLVELLEHSDVPPERLLPIDDVLDDGPAVPAHVLDLARFAADYYLAPLGSVVRIAVPPGLLRLPPALVRVGPRAHELLAEAEGDERRLLERVVAARRITIATLRHEGWDRQALDVCLSGLERRHAVQVVDRRPGVRAGGTVSALALADLDEPEREARLGRAPAQRCVVEFLSALGRPVLEAELVTQCSCSPAVVTELVRKGLLRRFSQARRGAQRRWELSGQAVPPALTPAQHAAVDAVQRALEAGEFRPFLLAGVTGSGKTEVYLRLAAHAAAAGRQTIVLVPEIGLTPALAGQLTARFGDRVAVLHSSLAEGDRLSAWQRARTGAVDVVAGPRSALWAPLERLALVVVDEEQDASYKQDEEPRYNARDLALVLGQRLAVPVLLASATPSLESEQLARTGRLTVLSLPERVTGGALPSVEVVDLRESEPEPGEHGQRFLSPRLKDLLTATVDRGEQAILLVNRRGWAPVLLCRECGDQASCVDCSIPLTVHRRRAALECHYCGFRRLIPERCPRCAGRMLDHVGAGTEKVADLVGRALPGARIDILDRDTARSPAQLVATLERFAAGATDVLVGTQMVSKGHHFPRVTLTAVVAADSLLGYPDFRGAERTFQMLTQLAGRAGRGERPGTVLIQSYHPEHHAVQFAVTHDVARFAAEELRFREAFRYPPFARMALVRYEAADERAAHAAAVSAARALGEQPSGLRVIGPALAPLARLRGKWRVQILLLAGARPSLRAALGVVAGQPLPRAVRRIIDVDPQSTV